MAEAISAERISSELSEIKKEITYIRKHIVDLDAVLMEDDVEALSEAEKDFKAGKTKRL